MSGPVHPPGAMKVRKYAGEDLDVVTRMPPAEVLLDLLLAASLLRFAPQPSPSQVRGTSYSS